MGWGAALQLGVLGVLLPACRWGGANRRRVKCQDCGQPLVYQAESWVLVQPLQVPQYWL